MGAPVPLSSIFIERHHGFLTRSFIELRVFFARLLE
jgi:hypothetical protein